MVQLSNIISFFKKKQPFSNFIQTDIHSHVLPGLDDGAATLPESIEIIKKLSDLGYKKLVTSPHIMNDFYPNTVSSIQKALSIVREEIVKQQLSVEIEAIAEYYVDEHFARAVSKNQELLHIKKYILIETGFMSIPAQFDEIVFQLLSLGYKPIFAHPERYIYAQQNFKILEKIFEKGIYFQIDIMSLTGHYSTMARQVCEKLIDHGMVHFVGSDCHHIKHLDIIEKSFSTPYFRKLAKLPLLNNEL